MYTLDESPANHIITYGQFRVTNELSVSFGGEGSRRTQEDTGHGKSTLTPYRKSPGQESNLRPSGTQCCLHLYQMYLIVAGINTDLYYNYKKLLEIINV